MTDEEVIKEWRSGFTVEQLVKAYVKKYNKQAKTRKEKCIKPDEARAYIEPIIFKFETKDWKK